jgi:hypothetical protein
MENPFDLINERLKKIEALLTEIKAEISSKNEQQYPSTSERLVGDKALATYLGCTSLTVLKLRKSAQIPYYRFGNRYYYKSDEIDATLKVSERRFGEKRGRKIETKNT